MLFNLEGESFVEKYGSKCPVRVRERNSDDKLYKDKMEEQSLVKGMKATYIWIEK